MGTRFKVKQHLIWNIAIQYTDYPLIGSPLWYSPHINANHIDTVINYKTIYVIILSHLWDYLISCSQKNKIITINEMKLINTSLKEINVSEEKKSYILAQIRWMKCRIASPEVHSLELTKTQTKNESYPHAIADGHIYWIKSDRRQRERQMIWAFLWMKWTLISVLRYMFTDFIHGNYD